MGKKSKKVDFQKVKLKVGRHLSGHANITKTKFKSKSIIVPQQLKKYVPDKESKQKSKVEITNLIKQLDHYSGSLRHRALLHIKKLVSSHGYPTEYENTNLIGKVCMLLLDANGSVRQEAVNLLTAIFKAIPAEQLVPLYPNLRSYLQACMTHIDVQVRIESLNFVDILLLHASDALSSSGALLKSFLGLISSDNDKKRSLIVSPSDQINTQNWRMRVFKRLQDFLDCCTRNMLRETMGNRNDSVEDLYRVEGPEILVKRHHDFRPVNMLTYSLPRAGFLPATDCSMSDPKFFESFLSDLMPLLFDTWRESSPVSHLSNRSHIPLDNESAIVITTILHLFSAIAEFLQAIEKRDKYCSVLRSFKEKYSADVQSLVLWNFPFSVRGISCMREQKTKINEKVALYETINFAICRVFSLIVVGTQGCIESGLQDVLNYLLGAIEGKRNSGDITVHAICEVLKRFLPDPAAAKCSEPLLRAMYEMLQRLADKDDDADYQCVMQFFIDLALDLDFRELIGFIGLNMWLENLPKEFASMTEENRDKHLLVAICKISCRGYPAFKNGLQDQAEGVISQLGSRDTGIQKTAVLLVTKIPILNTKLFHKISVVLCSLCVALTVPNDLIDLFSMRLSKNCGFSHEEFLGFLLNTTICISACDVQMRPEDIELFQPVAEVIPFYLSSFTILPNTEWEGWHGLIVNMLLSAIDKLTYRPGLSSCVQHLLLQFLCSVKCIPIQSVAGALELYSTFAQTDCMSDEYEELELMVADLLVAFCLYQKAIKAVISDKNEITAHNPSYILYKSIQDGSDDVFGNILRKMQASIAEIQNVEAACCVKDIIVDLMRVVQISGDEYVQMTAFLNDIKAMFGDALQTNACWKDNFPGISAT